MGGNAVALAIKISADGKAAEAGIDGVTRKTSKMAKAGQVAGRLLAAGLLVAAGAAVKAADAAAQDEQAQAKLASALKKSAGARAGDIAAVEDWIAAQGKALGVADDQLRPALENLVSATKNVGEAQKLASVAMDISARKGVSLEAVSKSLARAVATGNVSALGKYGVATKDAEGKARSMEAVQKDLAKLYKGGAAAAADTAAGKQQRLKVAMGELQEEIGAKLLPALLKLAEYGLKVVDWIDRNQAAAAAIVGTLFGLLAVVKLVSAATAIWSAITKVAAAAQAVFNAVMAANPVLLVVLAVVALAAALVLAYKKSETFRNIVNAVFRAIADTVSAVVGFIKNNWEKLLVILLGPIGLAVVGIIKHRDSILEAFKAVIGWVRDRWGDIKGLLDGPIGKAKDAITSAFSIVLNAVQNVINKVQELINKLIALKNAANGSGGYKGGGPPAATSESGGGGREPQGNQRAGAPVVTITVNGALDPASTARQIERLLRRNGVRLGTAVGAA